MRVVRYQRFDFTTIAYEKKASLVDIFSWQVNIIYTDNTFAQLRENFQELGIGV